MFSGRGSSGRERLHLRYDEQQLADDPDPAAGGAPTANPFSNQGGYGIVFDPGTNSLITVNPPGLFQINLANGNPGKNSSQVFNGTEYLTVQVVPEPSAYILDRRRRPPDLAQAAGTPVFATRERA